tara:strand:- start:27 stop:485 length:459 start_codon:yes stop_codon:yes gene_type:complete
MSGDEILLYGFYSVFLVCLALVYRFSRKAAIINFLVLVAYTASFLLYFNSIDFEGKGGSGFVLAFFLLVIVGLHFLGILTYLVLKWLRVPQKSNVNKKYLLSIVLSVILMVLGVLFQISHWPFGKPILFTGIGLSCLTLVFFVVQKIKRETK